MSFDPNAVSAKDSGLFGLPFSLEEAKLVVLPVAWEATVSFRGGTSENFNPLFNASKQIDLMHSFTGNAWQKGIAAYKVLPNLDKAKNAQLMAQEIIQSLVQNGALNETEKELLGTVNEMSELLNDEVFAMSAQLLEQNKIPVVLGGDHSTPFGLIKALAQKHKSFGLLQLDAHADLRKAYEGFAYSHASIMYNVLREIPEVSHLIQVGIRDYCEEEVQEMKDERVHTFLDNTLNERLFKGQNWNSICQDIVEQLPQLVYVSYDIDALELAYCPQTGTPVPGGLTPVQVNHLLQQIVVSGRKIISFDLCEVVA